MYIYYYRYLLLDKLFFFLQNYTLMLLKYWYSYSVYLYLKYLYSMQKNCTDLYNNNINDYSEFYIEYTFFKKKYDLYYNKIVITRNEEFFNFFKKKLFIRKIKNFFFLKKIFFLHIIIYCNFF